MLRGYVHSICYKHAVYLCFALRTRYFFFLADHEEFGETIIFHRFVIVAIPNMKYLPKEGKRV